MDTCYLKKVFWQDIRNQVAKVSPELAKLVDEISPGKAFPLYLAHYPYGSMIVEQGVFRLPTPQGKLASLDDASFPASVKDDLAYTLIAERGFPAGIVLNNSMELFAKPKYGFTSWHLYQAGTIFALWYYLENPPTYYHPPKLFSISAGARSLFMLPDISDKRSHQNLCQHFGLKRGLALPRNILDQWDIFTALSKSPAIQCDWHTDLLFFSGNWLKKINSNDARWLPLSTYLYRCAWDSSGYLRNKIFFDFAFSQALSTCKFKPNPYLANTAKYLFNIGTGEIPAYSVATDNSVGPVDLIQKAYLQSYHLEKYAPTMLHIKYFSLFEEDGPPVYYSLPLPSAAEFAPRPRKLKVVLQDMRELKELVEIYRKEILSGRLKIEDTPFGEIARNVDFEFFHNRVDCKGYTTMTEEMPKGDARLITCPEGFPRNLSFAYFAPFLRGCIRLRRRASHPIKA